MSQYSDPMKDKDMSWRFLQIPLRSVTSFNINYYFLNFGGPLLSHFLPASLIWCIVPFGWRLPRLALNLPKSQIMSH